jgi:hypothetical protein
LVKGLSLENKTIYGQYRGPRNSFGVYVFGQEGGHSAISDNNPSMHICLKLSLELQDQDKAPKLRTSTTAQPLSFQYLDFVQGRTSKNKLITGYYGNSEGKYAWIRGWMEGTSKLELKQSYKVLASSLRKS